MWLSAAWTCLSCEEGNHYFFWPQRHPKYPVEVEGAITVLRARQVVWEQCQDIFIYCTTQHQKSGHFPVSCMASDCSSRLLKNCLCNHNADAPLLQEHAAHHCCHCPCHCSCFLALLPLLYLLLVSMSKKLGCYLWSVQNLTSTLEQISPKELETSILTSRALIHPTEASIQAWETS